MAIIDYFPAALATDQDGTTIVRNAVATVYALSDEALANPLALTDLQGVPMPKLTASSMGVYPAFRVVGEVAQIVAVSGNLRSPMTSLYGVIIDAGLDPATVAEAIAAKTDAAGSASAAATARAAAVAAAAEAKAVGNTNDTIIEGRIKATGSKTELALRDKIADVVEPLLEGVGGDLPLTVMNERGAFERDQSRSASLRDYENAAGFTDEFVDLTGWISEGLVASGGFVTSAGTAGPNGSYGAKRAIAGLGGGKGRIVSTLVVPASDTNTGTYIGVNGSGNSLLLPADIITAGSKSFLVGVINGNARVVRNGSTLSTGTSGTLPALPAGTYTVTIDLDETKATLTLTNADATVVMSHTDTYAAIGGAPTHVVLWSFDAAPSDYKIGPVAARGGGKTFTTSKPVSSSENRNHWHYLKTLPGGGLASLALPAGADSRYPVPLVIYAHGSGENYNAIAKAVGSTLGTVVNGLLSAGYAVISGENGGIDNWGNPACLAAVLDQYRFFRDRYPLGPVLFLTVSMGNLAAGNTLPRRALPNVAGWYGIDPVLNLAAVSAMTAHRTKIRNAYGIATDYSDYATKTAGHDPMLRDAAEFRGIPVRFSASPDDTVVLKTENTDPMLAKLTGTAAEASLYATTGGHVTASHYNLADILSFFDRCRGLA